MRTVRGLALAAMLGTLAVATMGSYVSRVGAGLACPDWPLCHGRIIPPLERLILLEWTHRLLVSLVGLLVLGLALAAWRYRLRERRLALLAFGVLLAQAGLGGAAVLLRLPPFIVAAHQGLALIFFGTLVALTVAAFRPTGGESAQAGRASRTAESPGG